MIIVLLLGFASGLPLALTGSALQAWMVSEKVDLTIIGIFSLVGLPYTLKFLWAPLMDRYVPPFLGRRRGWILLSQLALVLGICAMGLSHPAEQPGLLAIVALFIAFFSASQDIVIDAYKIEILKPEEFGAGAGVSVMGYRLAMIVSGGLALIMSDHMSWQMVYFIMAGTLSIGVVATLLAPEPTVNRAPKSLKDAVVLPFMEFFGRKGSIQILLFLIFYKMDVVVATAMTTPFILQLGFSRSDLGSVNKIFGMIATIAGALVGGAWMIRYGMKRSLWTFGIFQAVSGISFIALAAVGHHYPMLVTAIAVENFCSGMGNAAYAGFLMSLCDKRFSATQYALLSSLMAVTRVLAGAPTGWLAKNVGWTEYFVISILISVPGLLLLTQYEKWVQNRDPLRLDIGEFQPPKAPGQTS